MAPSDNDNLDPSAAVDKAKDLLGKGKDAVAGEVSDATETNETSVTEVVTEGDGETVVTETTETTETVVTEGDGETVVTETTETVVSETVVEEGAVESETVVTETVVEETVVEEAVVEEAVVTETVVEETVVEETEVEDAVVEEAVVTETVVEETVVEETVVKKAAAAPVAAAATGAAVASASSKTVVQETTTEAVEPEPVVQGEVVETGHVTTERSSGTWPSVLLGLMVLFGFIILGLLLSQCGGDDETVGTAAPVTTAAPRTVVTVDPQTGVDPVRKALDANGYEDVGVGVDGNGRVKITGEVPDLTTKLDAASVATAALPAGVLLSNQLTIAPAPPPTTTTTTAVVIPDLETVGTPNDDGIVLTGEVPNDEVRAAMVAAAAVDYGEDNVVDRLTIGDGDLGDFVVRAEVPSRGAQRRLQATGASIAEAGGYTFVDEITRPNSSDLADELNALVELEPILFDVNSAGIRPESRTTLDKAVEFFEQNDGSVEVGGHTDSDGSDQANQSLSEARANAVRQYLIDQGVDGERMAAAGYGEAQPVATNETPDGRQLNRRIEFGAI